LPLPSAFWRPGSQVEDDVRNPRDLETLRPRDVPT
jgi:hypothetical protein